MEKDIPSCKYQGSFQIKNNITEDEESHFIISIHEDIIIRNIYAPKNSIIIHETKIGRPEKIRNSIIIAIFQHPFLSDRQNN